MTAIAEIAPKLSKLFPLLGSDKDGEVLAAVGAIRRMLRAHNLDLHDLAKAITATPQPTHSFRRTPPPSPTAPTPSAMADAIWRCAYASDWEISFANSIMSLLRQGRKLSQKQRVTLQKIFAERLGE